MIYSTYARPKELDGLTEIVQEEFNGRCIWSLIRLYVAGDKIFIELKGNSSVKPVYMVVNNWKQKDHGEIKTDLNGFISSKKCG